MQRWATAKINLFLRVLDRRPDGYHNIETVYQSVGLADRLTFVADPERVALTCSDPALPVDERNLAVRAARLMQETLPERVKGIRIALDKRIPVGGGLGGGSADAAATLNACNDLYGLGLAADELRLLGSQLGMDVPFLIEGGRAVGTARGEQIAPLAMRENEEGWAVIVAPALSISTRWAYEALDTVAPEKERPLQAFRDLLTGTAIETWARACWNSFERVVFRAYPELQAIRDRLRALGCAGALLTGSGAGVVGLTGDRVVAERAAREMGNRFPFAAAAPFLTAQAAARL